MQWRTFLEGANGIVFVVDVTDDDKFPLVKNEIESLINANYPANSAMMLLFNKIDVAHPDRAALDRLLVAMNLSNRTLVENNLICQLVSLLRGDGFETSIAKLYEHMNDYAVRAQKLR